MDDTENTTEIVTSFKPFRLSPITRKLENYMKSLQEGDMAFYDDLSEQVGLKCQPGGDGYSYVQSAIKRMEKDGHNFINIKTEGYKKINPGETVQDVGHKQKTIKTRISRGLNQLDALELNRLNQTEKLEYHAIRIVGGFVKRVLSNRAKIKIIEAVSREPKPEQMDYEKLTEIYLRKKTAYETEHNAT